MHFIVVEKHPNRPVFRHEVLEYFQAITDQREPQRMLNPVIVMLERAAGVVRRVNVDALDLAGELLFERFEGEEIVAEDEAVIEEVVIRDAVLGVIRLLRVFEQDAWLQPWPVLLPNPGQFEFLLLRHIKSTRDAFASLSENPPRRLRLEWAVAAPVRLCRAVIFRLRSNRCFIKNGCGRRCPFSH